MGCSGRTGLSGLFRRFLSKDAGRLQSHANLSSTVYEYGRKANGEVAMATPELINMQLRGPSKYPYLEVIIVLLYLARIG